MEALNSESFNLYLLIQGIRKSPIFINTFAPERLSFEEKNESFCLENASKLTHEFLYDILNKKISSKNS